MVSKNYFYRSAGEPPEQASHDKMKQTIFAQVILRAVKGLGHALRKINEHFYVSRKIKLISTKRVLVAFHFSR